MPEFAEIPFGGRLEMIGLKNTIKMLAFGAIVIAVATGCAAKKPPVAETPAPAAPAPAAPAPAPAPAAAPANDSYTVVRGDHLWGISAMSKIYGNPYKWPLIYKANAGQIKDADLIYPGQVLTITRNDSAAEVDRAVNHAKTRGAWSLGVVEESDKAYLGGM